MTAVVSYSEETLSEHLRLRNSLYALIREVLHEFLPRRELKEYLVPNRQVLDLSRHEFSRLEFYGLEDISDAVGSGEASVAITESHSAKIRDLLCDDPYLRLLPEQLEILVDHVHSSEVVPEKFLEEIRGRCGVVLSSFTGNTYKSLCDYLDKLSILKGVKVSPRETVASLLVTSLRLQVANAEECCILYGTLP